MGAEKIEEIKRVGKALKSNASEDIADAQQLERLPPNKERFDNLMEVKPADSQADKSAGAETVEPVSKSSLMDEVRNLNLKVNHFSSVNPKDLVAQATEVINHIESIKQKLSTPNIDIKPGTQTLLQNKLLHIDDNLKVALSKAGVEYTPPTNADNKLVNPIDRFLGFLTHGQDQLKTISNEVEFMHLNRKEISPADRKSVV